MKICPFCLKTIAKSEKKVQLEIPGLNIVEYFHLTHYIEYINSISLENVPFNFQKKKRLIENIH